MATRSEWRFEATISPISDARYQSHALRFAVRRPAESQAQFARRINGRAVRDALLVSIEAPEVDVDRYAAVATQVAPMTPGPVIVQAP